MPPSAVFDDEPLVIRMIAPVIATAVPPMPSTMAATFAVLPALSTLGIERPVCLTCESLVSWSDFCLARSASKTATPSAITPAPIIDQPTTAPACDGS